MKITFLGTGTSQGIPVIGSNHPVCHSDDKKDTRLRTSALIQWDNKNIIIDCGPDFRAHAIADDSFNDTYANQKAIIQAEIDSGNHPAEKVTELNAYITWLDNAPTKYAGVKHWKIPFPAFPEL